MNIKEIQDISLFNEKCIDFMSGKYIMADIKIKAILRAITESDLLRTVVSRCLNNYDFNTNFKLAVGDNFGESGKIVLPEKNREKVALIYNILRAVDEEVISFYDFINKYIRKGNELGNAEFQSFSKAIVQPFKDALLSLLETDFSDDTLVEREATLHALANKAREMVTNVQQYRLPILAEEDCKYLLTTLANNAECANEAMVYAMMIAIEYFGQVHKRCRYISDELKACLDVKI